MDEMKVYIVNLGKYVEGEDAGAWFTLPVDKDVVAERLGLDSRYEEIAIYDYELPFQIGEYESLDELNRLAGLIEDSGALDGLPENLRYYFDYEAYARNLKINGDLIECSRGVFVR